MAELNDTLKRVLQECGLGKDAVWKHKQSGQWIVYHWACETAAAQKGVTFDPPQIVHADAERKLAVIVATGRCGDRVEWSFGEAAPYNTSQTYPFAMAEKRAKDRVILKLIGLQGVAYSEEESDEWKAGPASGKPERPERGAKDSSGQWTRHSVKQDMRGFLKELDACGDYDELIAFLAANKQLMQACSELAPDWWREADPDYPDAPPFRQVIENKKNELYEEARRKAEYEPAQ
jgi:hypothetical protein